MPRLAGDCGRPSNSAGQPPHPDHRRGGAPAERHPDQAAGHATDPQCLIAYNAKSPPPDNADLAIHHSPRIPGKPYVETEGSPPQSNYWGAHSKQEGFYNYLNIGVYTPEMKERQKAATTEHIDGANGYLFASTWLQAPPLLGPNMNPGGDGTRENPGIKWWLDHLRERHGP